MFWETLFNPHMISYWIRVEPKSIETLPPLPAASLALSLLPRPQPPAQRGLWGAVQVRGGTEVGWGQDKMQEAFSVGINRTQTRKREGHAGLQVSSWEVVEVEMG